MHVRKSEAYGCSVLLRKSTSFRTQCLTNCIWSSAKVKTSKHFYMFCHLVFSKLNIFWIRFFLPHHPVRKLPFFLPLQTHFVPSFSLWSIVFFHIFLVVSPGPSIFPCEVQTLSFYSSILSTQCMSPEHHPLFV